MKNNFAKIASEKFILAFVSLGIAILSGISYIIPNWGPSMFFFGEPEYPDLDED